MSEPAKLGISGRIARAFQVSQITPLLALAGLLLGIAAAIITPKEEDPQIEVTMANVLVPYPGASVRSVENLVSFPLEQKLSEIKGVKHIYSMSRAGMAVVTVEFDVGVPRQQALVNLYNKIYSNADWVPSGLGVGQPLVKPYGIDDVPMMAVTLWSDRPETTPEQLGKVAHTLETELKRVAGTRDVYTLGAPDRAVMVEIDPAKLASYQLSVGDLAHSLKAANVAADIGSEIAGNRDRPVKAGTLLMNAGEVSRLVIGLAGGHPVYLSDVSRVVPTTNYATRLASFGTPPGRAGPRTGLAPAVTLAIAKKAGSNAHTIATRIRDRLDALRGVDIPEGMHATVTRDYGQTANDKADELLLHLALAALAVVLLVLFALGWREAIVVGTAVVVTLAVTLFASWAIGFTINRVSLFALIFSIGILVDDAIVVVENIHRHMALGGKSLLEAIPPAVDEVGGPTILATFTVIAALLPMAFVGGLMGPYMRPIPINASVGMLISLAVAFIVTPWLAYRLLRHHVPEPEGDEPGSSVAPTSKIDRFLQRLFMRVMTPFLGHPKAARNRHRLFLGMGMLVLLAAGLAGVKLVILKMLPFDNKSEFQVVLNMPEGSTLEQTHRALVDMSQVLNGVPEVKNYQLYAGTSAPMNFNGLVRQYYLRNQPYQGDIQVNLVDKGARTRQSHQIAMAVRPALAAVAQRFHAHLVVAEVPPGPPVMAPIVAEIYGPNYQGQRAVARSMEKLFAHTPGIADVNLSVENAQATRQLIEIDRARAAALGVSQGEIVDALRAGMGGDPASYVADDNAKYAVLILLRLPQAALGSMDSILSLRVRSSAGQLVPISEVVKVVEQPWADAIYHKDLLPYTFVTGDDVGSEDSPVYGMFRLVGKIADTRLDGHHLAQEFTGPPASDAGYSVRWSGEWEITYETFRDMGIAYSVGLLLIYLLVVGQFRSYVVPLIIMAPIPLTVIGVMPGHWLFGAQFTATSMIGMIALAGIIVRNSILLVDFINHSLAAGLNLEQAVVKAGAVRAKPIILTALAAMLGAFFILSDPIFQGLAVSLVFGVMVSTVLTLLVIPLLYYAWLSRGDGRHLPATADH
ncbi:MAG: efflux RND transporter permease subunit [Rhodanobacter sp.]|nr:MAG: efflux RND transporter permease subunit [Rhodanobacter sp.]TAM39183.1 MAG: efflux RND transporter permease subunit [Rhodanobacter sp.]